MTKDFCDICSTEIHDEHADVSITKSGCHYHHQSFCLPCFYAKGNWKKICVKPKKYERSPLMQKLLRKTRRLSKSNK